MTRAECLKKWKSPDKAFYLNQCSCFYDVFDTGDNDNPKYFKLHVWNSIPNIRENAFFFEDLPNGSFTLVRIKRSEDLGNPLGVPNTPDMSGSSVTVLQQFEAFEPTIIWNGLSGPPGTVTVENYYIEFRIQTPFSGEIIVWLFLQEAKQSVALGGDADQISWDQAVTWVDLGTNQTDRYKVYTAPYKI
ncbi:hypothetical protein N9933_01180 [bacterium]|nr:hypothetical protein [bacterium]